MKTTNEIGNKYGRLTVIKQDKSKGSRATWLCQCECGNKTVVDGVSLRRGVIRSCGCLKSDLMSQKFKTHGLSKHLLYDVHLKIKSRCYNVNDKDYKNYGDRGITVCDEWKNSFIEFYNWSIKNGYKKGLTIERIDVNGNYEPSNCTFIKNEDQALNRQNSLKYTYNGETKDVRYFSEKYHIKYNTLRARLSHGWDISNAIETIPIKGRNQYGVKRLPNTVD